MFSVGSLKTHMVIELLKKLKVLEKWTMIWFWPLVNLITTCHLHFNEHRWSYNKCCVVVDAKERHHELFLTNLLAFAWRAEALCYKPEGPGFETQQGERFVLIYLILPAALGLGVHSASNRNEPEQKNVSGE
jgi:hypothetical protein